jgi:hypothetical protein
MKALFSALMLVLLAVMVRRAAVETKEQASRPADRLNRGKKLLPAGKRKY